jgi:hypothetical protein
MVNTLGFMTRLFSFQLHFDALYFELSSALALVPHSLLSSLT